MDLIAGGFIGAVAVILGLFISRVFEYQDRKTEEKRWYAQYFLGLRIDALKKLHIALEEAYKGSNIYGSKAASTSSEDIQNLAPLIDEYRMAIRMAIVYLTTEQFKIFGNTLGQFRGILQDAMTFYNLKGKTPNPKSLMGNWPELLKSYENAVDCLKELLNPKNLREYVEKI